MCGRPPPRVWWGPRPFFGVVRRCPTLPHPRECSTIGAVGLSFRVRDGTGRFPHAMTTVTRSPNPAGAGLGGLLGVVDQQYSIVQARPGRGSGPVCVGPAGARVSCCLVLVSVAASPGGFVVWEPHSEREHCLVFKSVCVFQVVGLLVPVSFTSLWSSLPHPAYQPSGLAGGLPHPRVRGNLILKRASRLDAFSGYPIRT